MNSAEIVNIERMVASSRGEILFAKLIVFCEGQTEELALPIFAQKYFTQTAFAIGLNFINVGGFTGYLPFIRFATAFGIPWLIFSDGENEVIKNVKGLMHKFNSQQTADDVMVFLDAGNNFERQLIVDGFQDEIKAAILSCYHYYSDQHKAVKEPEIKNYSDEQLYQELISDKTKYGSAVAEQIIVNNKTLPPKIATLFNKIQNSLKI